MSPLPMGCKMRFLIFLTSVLLLSHFAFAQFVPVTMWKKKPDSYFVLTYNSYYPDQIGGLSGANQVCVTDLNSNNWKGQENFGTLTTAHVEAFLCDDTTCQNTRPNTKYIFATAGVITAGGASFTTDSLGGGPNDSALWSDISYFSDTWEYWTGDRSTVSSQVWGNSPVSTGSSCNSWASRSNTYSGALGGGVSMTDSRRWNTGNTNGCNTARAIICLVHPQ